MQCQISGAAARSRLLVTGLLGQVREQVPQVRAGMPQPPGPGVNPSRACITAGVTSSESLGFGPMPTASRYGARCGDPISTSSIFTYSAVARLSGFFVTK
jgi:hypothetical protein